MKFTETAIKGAIIIEPERTEDERGFFARTFCHREFEAQGLNPNLAQCSVSFNYKRGTLRGMHFQLAPHREAKLVRCTMGSVFDVLLDLREKSPTYCKWIEVELTAHNRRMLYVADGLAHGFQTLEDETEVFYQISEFYQPEYACGVRWNDPSFGIVWPFPPSVISLRDKNYGDFLP